MEWVCERCAGEDDELVLVRRLPREGAPGAGGGEPAGAGEPVGLPELWCSDCRAANPHEEAGP